MRVSGVGRDKENERCVIVYTKEVPTDDDLRTLHEGITTWQEQADNLAIMVGRLAHLLGSTHPTSVKAMDLLTRYGYKFKPHAVR